MAIKDHLKGIGSGLKGLAVEGYAEAQKRANQVKAEVQRRGGVGATLEQLADTAAAKADRAFTRVADRIDVAYSNFENAIYTDGKYDSVKARSLLNEAWNNTAEVARVYGPKAAKTLLELAKSGVDLAKSGIDKYVPSTEDKERYEGIGTAYTGILLKPNYEACLEFLGEAKKKLPSGLKLRASILNDIKVNAIGNSQELSEFYNSQENYKDKAVVSGDYLYK